MVALDSVMHNDRHQHSETGQHTLETRLGSIARMVLGLTHELNNVFGVVQSNVDIIRSHLPGDSPLKVNLNHLMHATGHATELIDLLQIYTQRGKTPLATVNLPPLLSDTLKIFKRQVPENCVFKHGAIHGKLHVTTCPVMLANALEAILQNAVDSLSGKDGCSITVELSSDKARINPSDGLMLGTIPPDNVAIIEITDSGEGIKPEVLEHILEPFFSTRTRARGLGLTHAVGLVFHCNNAIRFDSNPERGTTVQLIFPVEP